LASSKTLTVGGFGPLPQGGCDPQQNPKSTYLVDNIPYVWYNRGMKKMSDMSQINKMRKYMSGMSEDFFSGRHYEGSEINQGDFSFAEKHYESTKINLGIFITKG